MGHSACRPQGNVMKARAQENCLGLMVAVILLLAYPPGGNAGEDPALQAMVEADWVAQEHRLGREPGDPAAVRNAVERAKRLLEKLELTAPALELGPPRRALLDIERQVATLLDQLDANARREFYLSVRRTTRDLALSNPLITGRPIAFLERKRFVSQMLHEYLGYFCDYGDVSGGGVYVLEEPGRSLRTRDLVRGRLGKGNFTTLALGYDARTLYFAFAERAPTKPDFYSGDRRGFHLFAVSTDGEQLRQLTQGCEDDFDPCPLPDGGIAFMSTRRGGFGRCHNPWEPLPTYTLHRMDAEGAPIRTLSWHETNEWHPSVLNDGRIVFTRWDYVDRSAANFHGLWAVNPEGTNPVSLFGNYTMRINACYQSRAIPGSNRIVFVAGAHHADVGGSLVIVDPRKASLDLQTGEDRLEAVERLTPEVCFPEAEGWPKSYFHSPWPFSEDFFLVSFSHDPLPGMSSGERGDSHTGLYYFDRFGNLELLYRDPEISCMYPLPLAHRTPPPVCAGNLDPSLGEEGEFFLSDVNRSHFPLPRQREIRQLRIIEVLPKSQSHVANQPRIGHANAESARMLLGTVPVEPDGSAYFRAPARKPLYFQAVDAQGRAVQSMRSVTFLQPGERRGCVGCHEPRQSIAVPRSTLAAMRAPSRIEPGPDGSRPLSYPRLVQPVLDRSCVKCHDGTPGEGKSTLCLTGEAEAPFTKSYNSLKPFLRWYEWGNASISQIATPPGRIGADESLLTRILENATHKSSSNLSQADRQRLQLWLDANAPFYGTYSQEEQLAQLQGLQVQPPRLQ